MSREPHTIPGLSNQVFVHIELVDGKISCYPQRTGETVIYNCWDSKQSPQARPREVRWVVTGLKPDQSIRIESKDRASDELFDDPPALEIKHGFNTVTSGFPRLRAGSGRSLTWSYNIVLCQNADGKAQEVARLDPVVIIKDYP